MFLNERGEVCEGTITNVFVDRRRRAGHAAAGVRACCPGCCAAELLARGECREAVLRPADLGRGRVFVGNSLRGLIPARLAEA